MRSAECGMRNLRRRVQKRKKNNEYRTDEYRITKFLAVSGQSYQSLSSTGVERLRNLIMIMPIPIGLLLQILAGLKNILNDRDFQLNFFIINPAFPSLHPSGFSYLFHQIVIPFPINLYFGHGTEGKSLDQVVVQIEITARLGAVKGTGTENVSLS